ncbi:MAG: hypothetical protein HY040_07230 [Planctomycetes bacterium]|nr:hypothetical protein [Planctomycetota bacterium]
MPVYVCFRGDCHNLAFEEPGLRLFEAEGALGEKWLCVETALGEIPDELPNRFFELLGTQRLSHKISEGLADWS